MTVRLSRRRVLPEREFRVLQRGFMRDVAGWCQLFTKDGGTGAGWGRECIE